MLHLLETEVDCEELPTRLTTELLNIAILIVSDTPLDDLLRLTEDTSVNIGNRFDYSSRNRFPNG
ncbi:MAG TPA: hypothetical protein VJ044_14505 [Candidatus Hodarchaeales archaeon]|nr:hypothetical protein [Candidatus Hodarchaeales archaeon]